MDKAVIMDIKDADFRCVRDCEYTLNCMVGQWDLRLCPKCKRVYWDPDNIAADVYLPCEFRSVRWWRALRRRWEGGPLYVRLRFHEATLARCYRCWVKDQEE